MEEVVSDWVEEPEIIVPTKQKKAFLLRISLNHGLKAKPKSPLSTQG